MSSSVGAAEYLPARLSLAALREAAALAFATVHPSSILRAPDATSRQRERALLVDDLRVAAAALPG